jgi:hypothetical protein
VPCLPWLCLYALRVGGRAGRERRVAWLRPPCQLPLASEKLALLIFFFRLGLLSLFLQLLFETGPVCNGVFVIEGGAEEEAEGAGNTDTRPDLTPPTGILSLRSFRAQITPQDRATLDVKNARDKLKKYQKQLEASCGVLTDNARKLLKAGKKVCATSSSVIGPPKACPSHFC